MARSDLLLASKVVVVEEPPQIRNVPAAPTAIAAFLGVTERGVIGVATFVTSFEEFVEEFGSYVTTSDLPNAVESFFVNGGTGCWIVRTNHYTDITLATSFTAVKGSQTLVDRGGAATAAVALSNQGPFDLEPGEILEVNVDGAGADSFTLTATAAQVDSGNTAPFALADQDTLVYQIQYPGSTVTQELKTIRFLTADFSNIAAATAQEVVNVINRDGQGIRAVVVTTTTVRILSTKRGSGAILVIDAASTSITGGKLNIGAGTTNGAGNVADINAVTAAELVTGLGALSAGVAVDLAGKLQITGVTTGVGGSVVVTANTTALGIYTGALPITFNGSNSGISNTLQIDAKTEGLWIAGYSVAIEAPSSGVASEFNLRTIKGVATVKTWPNLSMVDTDPNYVETVINDAVNGSKFITVIDLDSPAGSPNDLPALGTFSNWAGQDDGLVGLVDIDFIGSQAGGTGLFAFDIVSQLTILTVPGRSTAAVANAMLTYCEISRQKGCFAILDPPANLDEQQIVTYVETTAAILNFSEFGAIYWPRVKILNPSTAVFGAATQLIVPPSGVMAGVYARTDASVPGGVFIPPAGIENGLLFGVLGFETDDVLDESKRDVVFPKLINPLTTVDGSPRHADGAVTLRENFNFPGIAERRGVIFIETSLKASLLFAKHRNNDRRLRMEVKNLVTVFLLRQFDNGAFRGDTPEESFVVDVSDALNTPERILAGELRIRVSLATQKSVKWVILIVTQDTRAVDERAANVGAS